MTQIGPFFYIQVKLVFNVCPISKGRGKLENWITLLVMINYMMHISKPENTYLVEGLCGTRKRITR